MQIPWPSKAQVATGKRSPAHGEIVADPLIIDIDTSVVHMHAQKQLAAETYHGGYGFFPLIAMVDYGSRNGTGEILAVLTRLGNWGAYWARAHIQVSFQALVQLPEEFYDEHGELIGEKILNRTNSAGASHEFLHHLDSVGLQISTTFALQVANERLIQYLNYEEQYWEPATDQHGQNHDNPWVIDTSKVIQLKHCPAGTRLHLRAERLHPGSSASLFDTAGNHITAFFTIAPPT